MKTLIWTLPTRIFHWLLAIGFTLTYILGDFDEFRNFHAAFGAFVGTLLFFRILFGFFGPQYTRFIDFPIGIKSQIEHFKSLKNKSTDFIGHNPPASLVMIGMILIGIFCSFSGYIMYTQTNIGLDEEFLEEAHEILATIFLILVGFHLIGLFLDTLFNKKKGTLKSIFTGYKNVNSEPANLSALQKIFSVAWFIVPFLFSYLVYYIPVNEENSKENYKIESKNDDDEED